MERWIHWKQVRDVVASGVFEVVDPLDADGASRLRFDGERRGVVKQERVLAPRAINRAIAPDRSLWETSRKDLLTAGNRFHGNFVVINWLALLLDCASLGHDRRDEQGSHKLWNCEWVQSSAGDGGLGTQGKLAARSGK